MKNTTFPQLSEQIESRQFNNGLRVFVLPRRQSAAVTIQAWIASGSIHEGKYLGYGLSHFLEHMLFQGSCKYPGNLISEKIAGYGGELNAATSSEYTYFYFNLPPEHLGDGLVMLDSMIREPLFPEDQFKSEREVILRELAMYKDSPLQNLFETMRMNTLRTHPLRYPVGGFPEQIEQLTPEIMRSFHALRYTPDRTFYVVVGDVEPEKVFETIGLHTDSWKRGILEDPVLPAEAPCLFRRRLQTEFPAPEAYYAASWQSPGAIHPDFVAVNAFSDIFGNGNSSRLYEELVKKRNLAQDILFYSHALSSMGYSGAAAIAKPEKLPELSERIFELLLKFVSEGPKAEELECLRNNQRAEYLRMLQTNDGIAPLIGKTVLHYSSPEALDFYLPALDSLNQDDLIRVGRQYFTENSATVVEQYPAGTLRQRKKKTICISQTKPKLSKLKSGQKLLFIEGHALPIVNFSILMPGGILNETPGQAGLTRLLAETLSGGCTQYNETDFDHQLELHAIDLNIEAGLSALTVAVTCPSEKLETAVKLIGAMLGSPLFPEDVVKREQEILTSSIKTALMKPEAAAKDLMRQRLFGKHPFGTSGREQLKNIAAITPDMLRAFYRRICLSAPKTVFGFSGDLSQQEAEKWTAFIIKECKWNKYFPPDFPAPLFPTRQIRKTFSLPRQQAVVYTALPGVQAGTMDADILNLIRADASSMASKLFQTVRNQNGLVYYAHFTNQPGFGFDGYMGYCGATTAEGWPGLEKIFRQEMQRLARAGLTRREFDNARKMLLFQLENLRQSPEELLSALVSSEFTGSSWEYVWNRKSIIEKMNLTVFNRRVKKLFSGKKTVTAVILPGQTEGM